MDALGKLARAAVWDKATTVRVATTVANYLDKSETRRVKQAAIRTLRDLGEHGMIAVEALEALAEHDLNERVRKEATETIEKIRSGEPARIELARLREELRKLREADRKMRDRMEKVERKHPLDMAGG